MNLTLLAIFSSKKRFDIRANTSWAALMPINLQNDLVINASVLQTG
jgi:hypothetical protein